MSTRDGPQFGTLTPGIRYVERQGTYALAMRGEQLLVIETAAGLFLPGGGVEEGETLEDALRREVREEAGMEVVDAQLYATARQYVIERETGLGFNKVETLYQVEVREMAGMCRESGDRPCWVALADAIAGLREEAQVWAARSFSSEVRDR